MKKSIIKFCVLLTAFLSVLFNLQGKEDRSENLNDKIYVSPGSIYVAADAIYLNMDGTFLLVDIVSKDENGIYAILSSGVRVGYCSKCGNSYSGSFHDHLKVCPANRR